MAAHITSSIEPAGALQLLHEISLSSRATVGRTRPVVAYGIIWARRACRIDPEMCCALRQASAEAGRALLELVLEAGCRTCGDVPTWLRNHRLAVMAILAG